MAEVMGEEATVQAAANARAGRPDECGKNVTDQENRFAGPQAPLPTPGSEVNDLLSEDSDH